jgi:hypothetical protein
MESLCRESKQSALLVCGGPSVVNQKSEIEQFIEREKPAVFSVNNPRPPIQTNGVFFGNRRRLLQYHDQVDRAGEVIFGPEIHDGAEANFAFEKVTWVNPLKLFVTRESPFKAHFPGNSAILATLGLVQSGYRNIYICGLDGYRDGDNYYYDEADQIFGCVDFERENSLIRLELTVLSDISERLGFSLRLLTATQFSDVCGV